MLQRVAVCCSMLQCVAVCCSMLQCVLQCVAVGDLMAEALGLDLLLLLGLCCLFISFFRVCVCVCVCVWSAAFVRSVLCLYRSLVCVCECECVCVCVCVVCGFEVCVVSL